MKSLNNSLKKLNSAMYILLLVVLMAISATGGYLIGESALNKEEEILLVIRGDVTIEKDTITVQETKAEWFSQRPDRETGVLTNKEIVEHWEEWDFIDNPPNAALSSIDLIVELTDPSLDKEETAVIFNYEILRGSEQTGLFENTSLFVDSLPTQVNGQITD